MAWWPRDKRFAFTIVDDTDHSTVQLVKPVYDCLYEHGLLTTKTVWALPPRDHYTGECLLDEDYRDFVIELQDRGFEIALHNIGSGRFTREEILTGLELFREVLGDYPRMQINHAGNPDNIYWGHKRFVPPLSWLLRLSRAHSRFEGEVKGSELFWGDECKRHIKYIRNHVYNTVNTLEYDRRMPYRVPGKSDSSNFWFSSSDAHTATDFIRLCSSKNLDRLVSSGGVCIVYTHFNSGYVDAAGRLDAEFERRVADIASRGGWYVPASTLLDHLEQLPGHGESVSYPYLLGLDLRWIGERLAKETRVRIARKTPVA